MMKKLFIILLSIIMILALAACSGGEKKDEAPTDKDNVQVTESDTEAPTVAPTEKPTKKPTEAPTEPPTEKALPFNVGDTATNDNWDISLTDAYASTTLSSSESSTSWTANNGYAFLVLEFDVTCLNSNKPTIDGDAITDPVATVDGNTYESWKYQYVASQIWCTIRNSYIEANLPLHIYVYAMIPESSIQNTITVNLNIAGQPRVITIN